MLDNIGQIIDNKYRIIRLIGEGGMGGVYEAEHVVLNRVVAIKIMHHEHVTNPEASSRFFQEARAASEIGHPNIVEIFDVGSQEDQTLYIVMELLRGVNLEQYMYDRGRLDSQRAVNIAMQVLSALHAAHAKNIIHRDLKSDNVFLALNARGQEEIKLLDFGIAKIQDDDIDALRLTKTGNVVGTPYYLSPEQAKGGRDIDSRLDIWGVGVLLYEMLTGCLPFRGENYNEVLGKILLEDPAPVETLATNLPEGLVGIVDQALAKDRDERFQTASKMMESLYPYCDPDTMMSTGVRENIKKSIVPPPHSRVQQIAKLQTTDRKHRKSDPNAATYDDLPEATASTGDVEVVSHLKRRYKIVAGSVLAGLVLIAAGYLVLRGEAPSEDPTTPSSGPNVAAAVGYPLSEAKPANGIYEQVTIELLDLPIGANVEIDGLAVSPPVKMKKSDRTVALRVTAEGYAPFDRELLLSQNYKVRVELAKLEVERSPVSGKSPKKRATRRKIRKSDKRRQRPSKKKKNDWETNPFN